MDKKAFIQTASIQFLMHPATIEQVQEVRLEFAINMAEALWRRLSDRGYGAKKEGSPRVSVDYYCQIEDQEYFDKCWRKYGKEGARNSAAKAWVGIEESEKEFIYPAIVKYIENIASGRAKAHFSTWLNQRRWEGFDVPESEIKRPAIDEKAQQIRHLEKMIAMAPESTRPGLQEQLEKLTCSS